MSDSQDKASPEMLKFASNLTPIGHDPQKQRWAEIIISIIDEVYCDLEDRTDAKTIYQEAREHLETIHEEYLKA